MKMLKRLCLLVFVFNFFMVISVSAEGIGTNQSKIVGFVAAWKDWSAKDIPAKKLTHIVLSFAGIENGQIVNREIDGKRITNYHFTQLAALKEVNPELKVLVSIGGWRGDGFSDAALTDESRKQCAKNVAQYVKKYNIDGIDIDWEFPVYGQAAGIKCRPEDKQNFTLLLQEIRTQLDKLTTETGKKYILTCALNPQPWALQIIEAEKIAPLVDQIHLMTFSYHDGFWGDVTGHHTPLYSNVANPYIKAGSAYDGVIQYVEAGIPPEKIILGAGFFAQVWENVPRQNNGLFQKVSRDQFRAVSYQELVHNYIGTKGYKSFWDDAAKAPYLYNASKGTFISYENIHSIRCKAGFVRSQKLGGMMIWELNQDDNGKLLNALNNALLK